MNKKNDIEINQAKVKMEDKYNEDKKSISSYTLASAEAVVFKSELTEISKQKTEIENKLKKLSNDNLKRLLHISPSPEEFTLTDKLFAYEKMNDEMLTKSPSLSEELSLAKDKSEDIFSSISIRFGSNLDNLDKSDSEVSEIFRSRSGSARFEFDTSNDEASLRTRRKSGPGSLKPSLRHGIDPMPMSAIKKSVTFSTPKLLSIDSEVSLNEKKLCIIVIKIQII